MSPHSRPNLSSSLVPAAALAAALAAAPADATEPVDLEMITQIRAEGLTNSQIMVTAAYLTDVIGPRLTALFWQYS